MMTSRSVVFAYPVSRAPMSFRSSSSSSRTPKAAGGSGIDVDPNVRVVVRDPNGHEGGWGGQHNNSRVHPDIGSSRVRRRRPSPHRRPRVPRRLQGGAARNVGMDALRKNSFPPKRERVFASFLLVCTSYIIGSLLWRNPNSLFLEAEKGNPRGIPRNSPGMHNLVPKSFLII